MFYTRIPRPPWFEHHAEYLNKSLKYFPLIGWIIGGIAVAVYGVSQLVLPASVSILLSMAAAIVATGAFHEDGLADVCDGFGGGWSKQQILNIMKDSRVGTYGTVGVTLLLAVKFAALYELQQLSTALLLVCLLSGHTVSRFFAMTVIQSHEYVQDTEKQQNKAHCDEQTQRLRDVVQCNVNRGPAAVVLPRLDSHSGDCSRLFIADIPRLLFQQANWRLYRRLPGYGSAGQ